MKNQKQKNVHFKAWQLLWVLIYAVQLVILMSIVRENRSVGVTLSDIKENLAISIDDDRYSELVLDAENKRLYLPGLSMYLPLGLQEMDLEYRITDYNGGGTVDMIFSSKLNKTAPNIVDECHELVRIEIGATQSQPRHNETARDPFTLLDGRKVYLYLPSLSQKCKDTTFATSEQAEISIRKLQSY